MQISHCNYRAAVTKRSLAWASLSIRTRTRFWTSSGFGPALASGGSFLNLRWLPGARFWAPKFVLGPSRPTISESPYICFKSSNHPLFASLAFVFPFAPPSFSLLDRENTHNLGTDRSWGGNKQDRPGTLMKERRFGIRPK